VRVAYTLEQCWHRVPGGTGVAAMRIAEAMADEPEVTLLGVAGRHSHVPSEPWSPAIPISHLPVGGPLLYDLWLRRNWPKVERATGPIDVAHATTLIPCATDAPMVVTVHDLAFLHDPSQFTRRGNRIFRRSLDVIRRRADLVLCSSQATMDDCVSADVTADRLRLVPLGVEATKVGSDEVARVSALYRLPERYLLFVGTVEPRKNLKGLAESVALLDDPLPLIVAGAEGWGDVAIPEGGDIRFIGFVPAADLGGLYAGAEVFCYPSEREGYGLPVLEAMVQGTPVVTSRGTATEETAEGAAVLVDPSDPVDIARGIVEASARRETLSQQGLARADRATWRKTAQLTADAYRELC
jgi:glycosyltransferase involved in cell wall biosynthesis